MHVSSEERAEFERQYDRRIGSIVGYARARRGMSQAAFAALLGVSAAYVCRIEKGRVVPSHTQLKRIAAVLGMRLQAPRLSSDFPGGFGAWLGHEAPALAPEEAEDRGDETDY